MLAERSAQVQLLRLTDLDAEMARVKHAAQSLPQHQAIQSLMEQRQQAGDNVTALTTNADDLEVATRRAEADLVPFTAPGRCALYVRAASTVHAKVTAG